jgi:hypothetical protein
MASTINASTSSGLVNTADTSGILQLQTANTTALTVDGSQNVGIGTTSPSAKLDVNQGSASGYSLVVDRTGNAGSVGFKQDGTITGQINALSGGGLILYTGSTPTERMRIDSSGNLLVGTTSASGSRMDVVTSASSAIGFLKNSNAAPYGVRVNYTTATPNGTDNWFYYADDATALRFKVNSNGGIANYSANNVILSDQREKKDIALAPNYLDKICQIPVKTFLFNDQTDTDLNLGPIAQDVQAVCPELVTESNWAGKDKPEKMRLSIYQTDLQYALMKSIQELKAINDTQAETINALTARIVALETA